jgi:hypothetical protein
MCVRVLGYMCVCEGLYKGICVYVRVYVRVYVKVYVCM